MPQGPQESANECSFGGKFKDWLSKKYPNSKFEMVFLTRPGTTTSWRVANSKDISQNQPIDLYIVDYTANDQAPKLFEDNPEYKASKIYRDENDRVMPRTACYRIIIADYS